MRILKALSKRCEQWVADNVYYEEWQQAAGGIAGDWRMIDDIEEALLEAGFANTKRWWQFWRKLDFQVS